MMFGDPGLPVAWAPVDWHVHELLFGYLVAAIAGFLLTAIPNWTGRLPVKGWPLAGLAALWIVGRIAVSTSAVFGPVVVALADLAFLAVLALVAAREILKGGHWHNVPIVAAIVLLFAANAVFHAELAGWPVGSGVAARLGVAIVTLLVALIGGRIVPSFTRNWLARHGSSAVPAPFGGFDKLTLVLTLIALAAWTVMPDGAPIGSLLAVAALLNVVRLARWQGLRTGAEPLLGILHLGYLWVPAGLALLAVSAFAPNLPQAVGLHALTVGSMATMTLAVMSRATLGHTGRALTVTNGLITAYLLITLAALSRVAAPLFSDGYMPLVTLSAATWVGAFACFLVACGPMLVGPRVD